MSHPFESVRQHRVEKSRAASIAKGHAKGGAVHSDEAEDRKMIKGMVKSGSLKVEGRASGGRLDRPARASGGKVKSGKTNVNVIIAPQGGGAGAVPPIAAPSPIAAGPPPIMPPRPPMMPPGAAGPLPPGAGGSPMMRKSGGRGYAGGGSVKEQSIRAGTPVQHTDGKNDGADIYRGRQITYATGGPVEAMRMGPKMDAGAYTGKGRLEKIGIQKRSKLP